MNVSVTSSTDLRPCILVVDDNSANQQLLCSQLKALGYDAEGAGNGQLGVERWQARQHDLIFADCTMPVMNGVEMARRIRALEAERTARDRSTRIIAITGSPEEYQAECEAAGMDAVLGKPLMLGTLRGMLQQLLPA